MRHDRSRPARPVLALSLLCGLALGGCATQPEEPATRLWPVVEGCMAHQDAAGNAAPCLFVDRAKGYAILKDFRGSTQFLLVATDRRWGIEDPRIEAADAPNYFADAWSARGCVAAAQGRPVPAGELSLAINSTVGRSDGQLHIHIDRLRPEVASALALGADEITVAGHHYRVRHVAALAGTNLFAALAPGAGGAMGKETIVVAGDPRGGFFVLDDHVQDGDAAGGEELQVDHPRLSREDLAAIESRAAGCAEPPR